MAGGELEITVHLGGTTVPIEGRFHWAGRNVPHEGAWSEHVLLKNTLEQIEIADRTGRYHAWEVKCDYPI